jgi:RimJ/RimL family protein N-acetyltransferase
MDSPASPSSTSQHREEPSRAAESTGQPRVGAAAPTCPRTLPIPPRLVSARGVVLRRHREDDLSAIVAQCQDEGMRRWTTVPDPYRSEDARWFLDHVSAGWEDGTNVAFAIEADRAFAGSVDLRLQEGRWAEIGYGLGPWARGRGVMTEAVTMLLDWAFPALGLAGVEWRAVIGNWASRRVAEKCGFRVEGSVRGLLVHRGERLDGWIGTRLAADSVPEDQTAGPAPADRAAPAEVEPQ